MIDTNKYQTKLLELKAQIETDLAQVATTKLNSDGERWSAVPTDRDQEMEMRDEVADRFEDLTERESAERTFEARLKQVTEALQMIADGTYGICKIGGEEIESERLEANPAASTCKAHIDAE
ncbi:MAG: hypothetical protein A2571_00595 [Candidatus Vogelbacteria bacterium RIFOXYD1_FULL_44_32]|uniref:Zinc finger DksA/TraR C4-type domain-containing protein n=1 Tax=Candidatus Vogelbacteria bacterium RIFOXYD1_FULL_44_32 TaxID=1802438 RepID=A0A1G2QEC5_9BACT|nr:MAG: hypothetical protein A2571_00595 [Candidatus Vogelbacteria bacterium RIFOXYD1_FULL_44_32]